MARKDQIDLARWACDHAKKAGASEARASVSRTHYSSLEYRERRVEALEESTVKGLTLSLYIDGKYSAHRTSDLRKDALGAFIQESVAMTRYLTKDEHRRLPEPEYYEGLSSSELELTDSGYDSVKPEDRHALVQAIESAALDLGGDKIISVSAGYSESKSEGALVSTNGFEGFEDRTDYWSGASVTAKDEGDKRPSDYWWEGRRYRGQLGDPVTIGERAVTRSLERIGASKIDTEELHMMVENRAAGRLVRFFRSGLMGQNLQQRRSFLEDMQGKKVASEHLTVIDEPLLVRGQNSRHYDSEGIAARRMPIVEQGVLKNYYIDTYYGRKLGMKATTGSGSNLIFESGVVKSPETWMKDLGRGILVTDFLGGNSNSLTGDFSVGIQGFLFENGVITKPIAEMNIAGNHLDFWNKLIGIGDDAWEFSSMRTPTLSFDKLVIAGA